MERDNLQTYRTKWDATRGTESAKDPAACFVLSQSAGEWDCMTNKSGVLPTLVSGSSTRMWIASRERWWTAREKFASVGFGVYRAHAETAGVRQFPMETLTYPRERIGNSMHVVNIGVALGALLLSVRFVPGGLEPDEVASTRLPRAPSKEDIANLPLGLKIEKRSKRVVVGWPGCSKTQSFPFAQWAGWKQRWRQPKEGMRLWTNAG